jgi:hypothetical protein
LAFAGDDEENDPMSGQMVSSPGDPRAYSNFNQELVRSMGAIRDFKPVGMTAKEYDDAISNRYALLGRMAGPDPYAAQTANIEEQRKAIESSRGLGQASALFKAANAAVQGNNAMRGLAGAGAAYGEEAAKVAQAGAAEKRALSSMNFNLLDAQRKERMGMSREAIEAANQARKDKTDLNAAEIAKQKALGTLAAAGARATKPTGTGGANRGPKINEQLAAAEIAYENNPTEANLKNVSALRRAVTLTKTTDVGTQKAELARMQILSGENAKVQAAMNKLQFNPKYLEAKDQDAVWKAELEKQRSLFPTPGTPIPVNNNSGDNTPPPPPGFR